MANEDYKVDYNDPRLTKIEAEKNAAIKESDNTYDNMINQSDSFFQSQIDAVNQYGETQKKNQQAETDFTIEKIEQQKDQLHKDYLKEQTAAYTDWQKQSNQYGANAEQMAASGLSNTGYSESSQVSMYNTYQNRVASARESYNRAVLNYNNAITEARLQNNSLLAEIAFDTLKTTTQLALEGFQYKNELIDKKVAAKTDISNNMWNRYADTLSIIHSENSLAEQIRSNKAQEAHNKSVLAETIRSNKADETYKNKTLAETIRSNKADESYKNSSLAEQKRQYNLSYELEKKNLNSSGSGGSGGSSKSSSGSAKNTKSSSSSSKSSSSSSKNTKTTSKVNTAKSTVSSKEKLDLGKGPISDNTVKKMVASGQAHVDPATMTLKKGSAQPLPRNSTELMIWKAIGKVK